VGVAERHRGWTEVNVAPQCAHVTCASLHSLWYIASGVIPGQVMLYAYSKVTRRSSRQSTALILHVVEC
jgi:hypothetical protein